MIEALKSWFEPAYMQAILSVVGAVLGALVVDVLIRKVLLRLVRSSHTDLDDHLLEIGRRPFFYSVLLLGVDGAARLLGLHETALFAVRAGAQTVAIILWAIAAGRASSLLLKWLEGKERFTLVQPRTRPIFDVSLKVLVAVAAIYLGLLSWRINVTGWLASAGVLGIVLGLAAKDTLANLFSGLFILADAPYRIGDVIDLGDHHGRGRVTHIGVRSTRLLTLDDVEVVVPNALIGNSRIVNESGGPHPKERIRAVTSVAYGSDIDRVRELLHTAARSVELISGEPEPQVRFTEMADSGLVFHVLGWVEQPSQRDDAIDALNTAIYKTLVAADVEIPFPQQDIYIKEMPGGRE